MKNSSLNLANSQRFILFISGVIVSAVVAELLELSVSWSIAILIILNVAMCLVSVFFISVAFSNLNSLLNKTEISVEYITEPYHNQEYTGAIYRRLQALVEQAEHEILYLSTGGIGSNNIQQMEVMYHPSRVSFLKSIEKNVWEHKDTGFKYILVRQIEAESSSEVAYSKPLLEHCEFILEKRDIQTKTQGFVIDLLGVPSQRMNSFLIIDKRFIVIFLYSDLTETAYASGIMLIEDRGGKMMNKMSWYFAHLERVGRPLQKETLVRPEYRSPSV